ncbi:BTAD domain-containing putative transcriptional regulator [Streptomyces sp. DSM 41014]|uniref:BTAD domain-containing putative transcriptional regulator n=1 Tax=Streptomyces hintoniae TaxID=3075521 RepID=A0ABU2UCC9_9ACTN|nr:BTAD domain-containing putative transcriptional regulator [Streptomyces sp. DSM 41014]MDT0470850.1 BTAD domain-containing putative transcriptional regulator [Streptomyces sp. DSM 41014]
MEAANADSVRLAVLGPVRAWRGAQELDLGSPQQRVVLTALLLRLGRPVTVGELIDAVWGDDPPHAAVSVLRTYVSRLRKVLEPDRGSAGSAQLIVSAADGYLADLPEEALDLTVFAQRIAEAKRLRADGQLSAAAELLHAALDGWEGTPLAGLPGPLAEVERSRLTEVRLNALESRLDLDLRLGRHHDVVPELVALAADHPLRERPTRLLMLALYRSGRQAEALAVYRRARNTLVAELGVEPGGALRGLQDRILAADPSLDLAPAAKAEPQAVAAAPAEPLSRPAQLPADLASFTGRAPELAQLRALLPGEGELPATVVINAIAGMAGVGKTALAVHWAHEIAHRFPDGQLYINLRGFDPTGATVPPEEAVRLFLDALGVPSQRIPSGLDAQAGMYRSLLADRRVLILLDNALDTAQVRPLLPGSPGCMAIVTSRNWLTGLVANDGAHPLTLKPLDAVEAHGFLARRLGEARLVAEPGATEEIIERCARLPLALAIVAARAAAHPDFPLSAVAEELCDSHDSLDAFAGGDLSTDVRAIFSWSHRALSAPAARLFRLLGLHFGPHVSAPAAAALAGLTVREARVLLGELTHAHLLLEYLPGRYSLHDLLRVYAAERVMEDESETERNLAVDRLLFWYVHTAAATYPFLTPNRRQVPLEPLPEGCAPLRFGTYDQALEWCDGERPNLVAAVQHAVAVGRPGVAWRLTAVLWGFFYLRSHVHDWLASARTGLAGARASGDELGQAWALGDVSAALTVVHRDQEAIGHLKESMVLHRRLKDIAGRAHALGNLGNLYLQTGQLKKSIEYTRRGLVVDRHIGSAWGEGISLVNLGDAYQRLGLFDEAMAHLEEAMTVLRALGNRWVEGVTLDTLGTVHQRLGRHDDAIKHYYQAIEAHRDVGNRWGEGHTLGHLGDVHRESGEPEAARTSWRQALALFEESDHPDAEQMRQRLRDLDGPPQDGPARG